MQATRGASLITGSRFPLTAVLIAVAALIVDQVTKLMAVEHLTDQPAKPVLGEVLQLNLTYNPGAAFGLGGGFTPVFAVLAAAATVVALWFIRRVRTPLWALALGLLTAGIAGNLIDRLVREPGVMHGHVVDFLQLPNWPIFNVADVCINLGVALILLQTIRGVQIDGGRVVEQSARGERA